MYNIVLFIHILGVMIMFAAVGITLTAMIAMLHSKTTDALRNWSALAVKMDGLLPFSVFLILIPGLYLLISTWGWKNAWINISFVTLILMTLMGPIINLRRLKVIFEAANLSTETVPDSELMAKVRDRVLWNSVMSMSMLVVGIIFLMTVKPAMAGSFIGLIVAVIFGFLLAGMILGRAVSPPKQAQTTISN